MKYSIIFILTLTLLQITNIASTDAWICNPDNTHRCPKENQTCCPSIHASSKYVCFESPKGVCCPDDQNFCPNGTVCNMINLTCDPEKPSLTFLSLPSDKPTTESIIPIDTSLTLKSAPTAKDMLNFSVGFFKGFSLFSNLPDEHNCLDKLSNPIIAEDVVQIYNLIKQLNFHSDFINIIKNVVWYAIDIYTNLSEGFAPCKYWSQELKQTGDKIVNVFKEDKYVEKLALHVLLYIGDYKDKATKGYDAIIAGDYSTSGEAFGDLLKFGLLWEVKN